MRIAYSLGLLGFLAAAFGGPYNAPLGSFKWAMNVVGLLSVVLAVWTEGVAWDESEKD